MNEPDIGFTPAYQELWTDTAFGGQPCYYKTAGIEYRYYKRQIPDTDYFDITSPYGYAGPVGDGDWTAFYESFIERCRTSRIVSEFARLHPWESRVPVDRIVRSGEVAYVDLTQTEDAIWKGFDKGCRSSAKKALISSVAVLSEWIDKNFAFFYRRCMDKLNASHAYYFTDRFWQQLRHCRPVTISVGEAMALFFFHGDYATYFLSASDKAQPGAMNLILWTAIKAAKSRGCKVFNLGGGLHDGDTLSSFKRSFTRTTKPFYTYRRIHLPEVYADLCKAKGIDPQSDGYFPRYRA